MNNNTLQVVQRWIVQMGYYHHKQTATRQYSSHPDAESIASVTDTLNDCGIGNAAVSVPFETIFSFKDPFLALLSDRHHEQLMLCTVINDNSVTVFNGEETKEASAASFERLFTGIVILIDRNPNPPRRRLFRKQNLLAGLLVMSGLILQVITQAHIIPILYSLAGVIGLGFSILLLAQELGVQNQLLRRFCSLTSKTSCSSVLSSRHAKISQHLSLTDIGVVYFSGQLLALVIQAANPVLYGISVVASLFSFYSVYIQAFRIKKWCPLCLGAVAVLIFQGVIGAIHFEWGANTYRFIILTFVAFLFISGCWRLLKPVLQESRKIVSAENALLGFRRNYHLFLPFYRQQLPVDRRSINDVPAIFSGSPVAPVRLTLITNPLCKACQQAHEVLESMLSQYQEEIMVEFVFYVPSDVPEDPRTRIAANFLHEYAHSPERGIESIRHWYKEPDLERFKPGAAAEAYLSLQLPHLHQHRKWCMENNLTLTPQLLINGKVFPMFYQLEDLSFHLAELIEMEKQHKVFDQTAGHSIPVLVDNT